MDALERTRLIAEKARAAERRDWWLITKPGAAEPIPVLFCPPLLQSEVFAFGGGRYAHCGVVPLLEQVD